MKVTGETKSTQTFRQKDCYRAELWSCKTGIFFFYISTFHAREKVKCVSVFQKEYFVD